jgi:hypothetical protein
VSAPRHPDRPPQIAAILTVLGLYEVDFVLVGSVAAAVYGADVAAFGDLDVTPALETANLARLASALEAVEATPASAGHWEQETHGERRWVEEAPSPDRDARLAAWRPDPGDPASFDHLYRTRLGNLDVVPDLAGSHERLCRKATRLIVAGVAARVAHVDDLLAGMTKPRREKDAPRVRQLRQIQWEQAASPGPPAPR